MQFTTSVTQKGQATIPALIRQKLGIMPNTKIIFEINENNDVVIKPVKDFFSLKGSIKSAKPFTIEAMERAVADGITFKYGKKFT